MVNPIGLTLQGEWREGKSSPYTGKRSARPAGKPGDFLIVIGAFATIPSPPLPSGHSYRINTEAPQYAFSRQGGIYRSDVVQNQNQNQSQSQNQIPGREPTASRWSAPGPGKRTRREDHALLIVRDEFRTGYSLIGLLASIARLRFTGTRRLTRTPEEPRRKATFLLCQGTRHFYFALTRVSFGLSSMRI
jgi:hypothetical protein